MTNTDKNFVNTDKLYEAPFTDRHASRSILIVDDDPEYILIIEKILTSNGYKLIRAGTGSECLELIPRHRPDLILLDVNLPDASGFDICMQIKADPDIANTHILFLSGIKTSPEDQAQGLRAGADGYLTKPVHKELLLARIEAVMRTVQTENSLRQSEKKHRRLFETMAQGVIYQAADGAIISANPAAERILGLTFDQMSGRTSLDPRWKMIKEDGTAVQGEHHPAMIALRTGETVGPVVRGVFHPDRNDHIWLSITAIPMFKPGESSPFQAYATFEDITERKRGEKALRKSENLFKKVFEILPIGLWVANKNGKLIQGNPAGVDIWGMEPKVDQSEYGVFKARRLPTGEEIAPEDWALAHTVNKGETIVDELLEIDAFDGKKKIILNYTAPVINEDGKVEMAIVVNQDITSRYHAEQALLAAKEAAEAANLAKSEFLANMSHEIRTPLNGIMSMMQLLSSAGLNPDQEELVSLGSISAKRLTRLLSDILDLSSIEAGKMIIRQNEFSLHDICSSIKDLFMIPAREKGIDFDCSFDSSLPAKIIGDDTRVQQVLFNLVGNAIKFTDNGSVSLNISPASQQKNGHKRIVFSITDTGTGIPEDKLNKLFQPFSQADGSLTRQYQGAGLGLVIVRRLVSMMDGNISVESQPGTGTTVYVVLPFKMPEKKISQTAQETWQPAGKSGSLNILLAEDDPLNQIFIKRILEKDGQKVTLVNNGKEAVDMLQEKEFDCILMDIQMPVMTGVEATRAIRESTTIGEKKDIPIIAVTAHTQPGDRESFLEAGMDDYVGKPVSLEDFQRVFSKFFGQKEMQT